MPIFKLLRSFVTLSLFNTTLQSEFREIHLILVQKQSFAQMISRYLKSDFHNGHGREAGKDGE